MKDGPKPPRLTAEDQSLWDIITRSIRPLAQTGSRNKAPDKTPDRHAALQHKTPPPPPSLPETPSFGLKPASVESALPNPGIDRRTAQRLRRGDIRIEAVLDLHGLHRGPAQDHLTRFILDAYASDRRCLLVITGKGKGPSGGHDAGILRQSLPQWLANALLAPLVLMDCPAHPRDGGSGARYILLRRRR